MGQQLKFIRVIGIAEKPKEIRVDEKPVDFDFDRETKSLRFEINENAREIRLIK